MKTILSLSVLACLLSTSAHARSFNCFSRYYTANQFTVEIAADAVTDTVLNNVRIKDTSDGISATYPQLKGAITRTTSAKYLNYVSYRLTDANPSGDAVARDLELRIPKNVMKKAGQFTAYLSDANADGSGSDGYFGLLCH